ncbi:MAG: hypothetical protein PHC88_01040 [Terrimicrobiaceae bacterium]|nr:hypothetical protein [Terrimicrobiaceae bacterium]
MPQPIADLHTTILEDYFFRYIDRRIGADETPLFTQTLDGEALSAVIAREFELPLHYAEAAIDMARIEVAL